MIKDTTDVTLVVEIPDLTIKELILIEDSLNSYYVRAVRKAQRAKVEIRPRKVTEYLVFIQVTLQHLSRLKNRYIDKTGYEEPTEEDSTL